MAAVAGCLKWFANGSPATLLIFLAACIVMTICGVLIGLGFAQEIYLPIITSVFFTLVPTPIGDFKKKDETPLPYYMPSMPQPSLIPERVTTAPVDRPNNVDEDETDPTTEDDFQSRVQASPYTDSRVLADMV